MSTVDSITNPFISSIFLKNLRGGPVVPPEAAIALASVLSGPGGEFLAEAAGNVIKAVAADPKGAAKLLREATQLTFPLVREIGKIDSDDGTTTIFETTTTVRREKKANYSKTTKTTTSTTERTTDPEKQQKKLERDLETLQKLVDGLEGGKVQVGDSSVTFEQIQGLVSSLVQFLGQSGNKEENSPPIDIGDEKPQPTTPSSEK